MKLLFCTNNLPGAVAIRVFTWSDWSHVAIIDGDEIIEAVYPKVRVRKLSDALSFYKKYKIVEIPTKNDKAIVDAVRSQMGKPYDFEPIAGFVFRRDWQKEDKWFCSELVAWAAAQGGSPLFRPEVMFRVTPQHLWMLADKDILEGVK